MDRKLKQYAELIVKQGANLQKGEMVAIASPVMAAELAEAIAEEAYKNGASQVMTLWSDAKIGKLAYQYESLETLTNIPAHVVAARDYILENKGVYICLLSEIPGLLKDVDPVLVGERSKASGKALMRFRESTGINKTRWCLAAYPNKYWAKQMFPDLNEDEALDKQWEYVHKTLRLDEEDYLAAWKQHQENLARRSKFLNDAKIKTFHYKNSIGTDFTIGMPKGYMFTGAVEKSLDGLDFTANLPTEEVFSSPDKNTAEGTLVSALPLVRNGVIIENFSITFEKGRIVDYKAEKGYETLKQIIETDEGSHYLGEIAIIGYNSPIQNLKALFYETLFDENASCHFAIGRAFPACLENGVNMSKDELAAAGLNDSLQHVDFMVGTADLSITATTESGEEIAVFVDGNWVI
ncbi:MAG: aminopeptidase [Clostridia bacterium]|nr:aminopeptidase [Clostridia bacterium]